MILGRESLALQGHTVDAEMVEELELSEVHLQDLSGNGLLGISGVTLFVVFVESNEMNDSMIHDS